MNPERRRQVEELYHAALKKEQRERAAFVAQVAEGDAELRSEVESLLAKRERPTRQDKASSLKTQTATDMSPGAQLGFYRIEALLGAGGMGRVYRALDTRLNRTVAIKVSREEFSERFQREARTIAALNHSYICTLYDVGPDYLVVEYVEGKPLQGPLRLDKVLNTGRRSATRWRRRIAKESYIGT